VEVPVEISGVGMFDPSHGQKGAAANDLELHPVLDIVFRDDKEARNSGNIHLNAGTSIGPTQNMTRALAAIVTIIFVSLSVVPPIRFLVFKNISGAFILRENQLLYGYLVGVCLSTYLGVYLSFAAVALWHAVWQQGPIKWSTSFLMLAAGSLPLILLLANSLVGRVVTLRRKADHNHGSTQKDPDSIR
jgi:hypothetical protein